jgi:photosystem II stability/assembly factor-like uncharacterized protein
MNDIKKIPSLTILFTTAFILFAAQNTMSQWIPQTIPVDKLIQDLEFADENTGWAITVNTSTTDTGYILSTTNGGTNWIKQHQGNYALYHVNVIDDQLAYAGGTQAGGSSLFLKTTNSGLNWIDLNIGVLTGIDAMYFVDANTGYVGDALFNGLYITTDGGMSWLQRQNGLTVLPRTLFFLNSDTGFCGGSNKIFKTTNAGLNWFLLYTFESPTLGNFPNSIQFLDNETGFVSLNSNTVGVTMNGGKNWSFSHPNIIGSEEIPDIYFLNVVTGWAGSDIGRRIYRSTNGGYNWTIQTDSAGSMSIHMYDSLLGWSGGRYGIAKTTNGGLTFISSIGSEIPYSYKLYQNYPNPFNPITTIRFEVSLLSEIKLNVFNILGQKVAVLVDQKLSPGGYEYTWNASNFSSGIYFYTLEAEGFKDTKKLVLLK